MIASTQNSQHQQVTPLQVSSARKPTPLFLPQSLTTHDPKAGLNPLADACSTIFSIIGKLKQLKTLRQPASVQKELIQEINSFQSVIKSHGYNAEYIAVCRYILCAFLDDIIANTAWGGDGHWENYALLNAFHQDINHHDKFFVLIERSIKEPALYIDLMELIYICLSLGYKGQYRSTEHNQYQLEQITNNLYKHIRAYRGNYSKTLSPKPHIAIPSSTSPKINNPAQQKKTSLGLVSLMTACAIMIIFISLGYLLDIIANEAFKNVKEIQVSTVGESDKL